MATANNTIKTRVQLKSDTEENWNKSVLTTDASGIGLKTSGTSFVPLKGELIVYLEDATHPFSRLKVGDGQTNVVLLPFIDSVTLNGKQPEIIVADTYNDLPQPGSADKLYIVSSTNAIYYFKPSSGYKQLSNFEYADSKVQIKTIGYWIPGIDVSVAVNNNALSITGGIMPSLGTAQYDVVSDVYKKGDDNTWQVISER